ncbi:MAG: glucosamine-6-phosphate deaminase [Raoultibacter sp.]
MEFIIAKDYEEMSRKAADVIADMVHKKPQCTLGLATGTTPIGLYDDLAEDYRVGTLDFSTVTTCNLDEYRGLSHDHPQSYHYFMRENLFNKINIDLSHTHVPDGSNPDAEAACTEYEKVIAQAGGIDLQLLGLGHNGHIGFNEPADDFPKTTQCVDLTESTIQANSRLFDSADEVPRQAYTMGIGTIMAAEKVLVVASGSDKAEIVRDAFFGPVTPRVPASVLQFHQDVIVIVDAEAGALCS